MSKIVIDARMWSESGIGRYLRNLVAKLQEINHDNEYYILLLKKDFSNKILSGVQPSHGQVSDTNGNFHKVLADFRWYTIKEQIELPRILKKIGPDLVHFPHFNVPIFYQGKFVVTIHDLIHQHFSFGRASLHGPIIHRIKKLGYKQAFRYALSEPVKILTPSEFVKKQLTDEWHVDQQKITVTYEGIDEDIIRLAKRQSEKNEKVILNRLGIVGPYIYYVGNAHPHKNIEGLIKAFSKLTERGRTSLEVRPLRLVLSGQDNYFWKRVRKEFKDVEGIVFTGLVTDEEMVAIYKNAAVFVMPSFEEGFGLPILEAFTCSCPVASSNAGSLKEVGGDGALFFDPKNIDEMAEKISQILTDKKLRVELIKKGLKRVDKFSWKKLAEETLGVYKKAINEIKVG